MGRLADGRRARVTSTSDPAGEWITISEVNTAADSTPDSTSKLFRGQVVLSSNASTQGTSQDGVWVQVGDIVTVSYVDSNGDVIDLDTVVVPGPTPTPTPIPTPGGIIPTPVPGTVTVAENEVEWASSNGGDMTAIEQDSTGIFYIRDDALETIKSGTAVFSDIPANSTVFNIAMGMAGAGTASTAVTRVLTAAGYSTSSPASTPLTNRADIIVTVGGSSVFVTGANTPVGEFTIISGASATTNVAFKYHVADVWSGTDSALRRAKVISTSDPAGEWVTISEIASATDFSPNATSRLFRGEVVLSSSAATQGTAQDGVWVQVGDIVVVIYLDPDGNVVDADTAAVPEPPPTPTATPTPSAVPTPEPSAIPTPVPGTVAVPENDVVWAAANGDDITTIQPDSTGILLIRDDALETTKSGTAVFSGFPANSNVFNIATGKAGPGSASTAATRVLTAAGYSTNSPASTPLTDRSDIVATVGASSIFIVGADNDAGAFTLIIGVNATTTATFKYHTPGLMGWTADGYTPGQGDQHLRLSGRVGNRQ